MIASLSSRDLTQVKEKGWKEKRRENTYSSSMGNVIKVRNGRKAERVVIE